MTYRATTGLITPPYSSAVMDHYTPSSKSNASIADLCAQTVCFLWFESLPTLHEAATTNYPHHTRIPDMDNLAKADFIKWTKDVLSTTQVSTNVVILAMLFIYRLKIANPSVKGKSGSEYRLLTVALMLGNKILDDNTYTNKTWADVTSINVKEIHSMEVEFLSNMRYQLMVTVEEWQQWLYKINLFVRYQQKQQALSLQKAMAMPHGLASPPMAYDYSAPFRNFNTYSPIRVAIQAPTYMAPTTRGRKRSIGDAQLEAHAMLPPHKRMLSQPSTPLRSSMVAQKHHDQQYAQYEVSPSKRQQLHASMLRTLPPLGKSSTTANLPLPPQAMSYSGQSTQSSSLSPSYLQVGVHHSSRGSPTTSSISQYSAHSHGPGHGYSPASLALQHRNSPYAPVQPVQRLVGKYQPIFHSSQMQTHGQGAKSLWYSQLAAGSQHPVYSGHVPLSAHGSPYGMYQQQR